MPTGGGGGGIYRLLTIEWRGVLVDFARCPSFHDFVVVKSRTTSILPRYGEGCAGSSEVGQGEGGGSTSTLSSSF
jgi:hypothetical protein